MTDLRTAAQQALEALRARTTIGHEAWQACEDAITALKAALAEPEGGGNLPPPLQKPEEFDHSIGADRFKVVRGAFWWHVLIGDSPTEHGKFRSRASAEKMAADLLREFRNGAFVQHEAALAEPVQEPVWFCPDSAEHRYQKPGHCEDCGKTLVQVAEPVQEPVAWYHVPYPGNGISPVVSMFQQREPSLYGAVVPLYATPPQRKPLTEEEISNIWDGHIVPIFGKNGINPVVFARAVERVHGITGETA